MLATDPTINVEEIARSPRITERIGRVVPTDPAHPYETAAQTAFSTVQTAFEILGKFRLAASTGQMTSHSLYTALCNTVRRDTHAGEQVAQAAANYMAGTGTWWRVQVAFAAWSNVRLVRVLDAADPPENLPLDAVDLVEFSLVAPWARTGVAA